MEEVSNKEEAAPQGAVGVPFGWDSGDEGASGYNLFEEEEALSIPGSADEEDEETEAIHAMALSLELQCRLQRHLDQLEAKAKAKAQNKLLEGRALASPEPDQGDLGGGQEPEDYQWAVAGSSTSFGEPFWGSQWNPREKGDAQVAAEAHHIGLKTLVPEKSGIVGRMHAPKHLTEGSWPSKKRPRRGTDSPIPFSHPADPWDGSCWNRVPVMGGSRAAELNPGPKPCPTTGRLSEVGNPPREGPQAPVLELCSQKLPGSLGSTTP